MAAQDPELGEAVQALAATGEWGGQVHVTLTSFAGAAGHPDTWGNVHGSSLVAAAEQLANAAADAWAADAPMPTQGLPMPPMPAPWTGGGHWGCHAQGGDTAAFYSPGPSRTLAGLAQSLQATALRNPRHQSQLHATFRAMRRFPGSLPALASLEWEVAVVRDGNPADEEHRDIMIKDHERFVLLSASGGGGGGGGAPDGAFAIIKDATTPRVLMVRSRGGKRRWMLPGGKIDPGETPFYAACRELQEESGYEQRFVQLTSTGHKDGPHVDGNVVFFLKEFDFGGLGHARRVRIFAGRGTPGETSEYGFATLLPDGRTVQVQDYDGTAKPQSELRYFGTKQLLWAFALM